MDEDLELITKFKNGQLEGFEMLVKKYHNRIINIANSFVGNTSDAEDIASVLELIDNAGSQSEQNTLLYNQAPSARSQVIC